MVVFVFVAIPPHSFFVSFLLPFAFLAAVAFFGMIQYALVSHAVKLLSAVRCFLIHVVRKGYAIE
jgi:hypothetical protein